jgi:hypothetical protein
MTVLGHPGDDATGDNGRLKGRFFNVKPDATPKTPLLQRPSKHLLTGEGEQMGMPDDQNSTPNVGTRRGKAHPLRDPFGEIVHAVHLCSIDAFNVGNMSVRRSV